MRILICILLILGLFVLGYAAFYPVRDNSSDPPPYAVPAYASFGDEQDLSSEYDDYAQDFSEEIIDISEISEYYKELTPYEVITLYFESLYDSYIYMEDTDVYDLLDLDFPHNIKFAVWADSINQRRRLLFENDICYVETTQFEYEINFIEEDDLNDGRIDGWLSVGANGLDPDNSTDYLIHFEITGEESAAYPPIMALNSQHSIRIKYNEDEEAWKIAWHYYPGAISAFRHPDLLLEPMSDDEALQNILQEFAESSQNLTVNPRYNARAAVEYAMLYTENKNPDFYCIDDWMGNCANFISQCIWAGYHAENAPPLLNDGRFINASWYAGLGGGSPSWENVGNFWNYAVSAGNFNFPEKISSLIEGDIVQTRPFKTPDSTNDFNHSLILVDKERLVFAQNSPACFVYLSDIINTEYRFVRP